MELKKYKTADKKIFSMQFAFFKEDIFDGLIFDFQRNAGIKQTITILFNVQLVVKC